MAKNKKPVSDDRRQAAILIAMLMNEMALADRYKSLREALQIASFSIDHYATYSAAALDGFSKIFISLGLTFLTTTAYLVMRMVKTCSWGVVASFAGGCLQILSENRFVFPTEILGPVCFPIWNSAWSVPSKTLPFCPYGLGGSGVYARPLGLPRGAKAIAVVLRRFTNSQPPKDSALGLMREKVLVKNKKPVSDDRRQAALQWRRK